MPQGQGQLRWAVDSARRHAAHALAAAATFVLLLVPDIAFALAGYQTTSIHKSGSVLMAAVLAVALTLIVSRRWRLAAAGFLLGSQVLWLGCLAYFGKALGPEQIVLSATEIADVTIGIAGGWRILLPALITVAMTGGLMLLILACEFRKGVWRDRIGGWLFAAVMGASAIYWLSHESLGVSVPGSHTLAALGPFQATVSAARLLMTPVAAAKGMQIRDQDVRPVALEAEPQTVVVIMGEGITPTRLSLFGYPAETSPRLAKWRREPPPGFELIAKIGFAAGVATFASVPGFIKMSYIPVEGEWRGVNVFDLAYAGGFASWFLSAQSAHFLNVAGGARRAERVFAEQGNEMAFAAKHDDLLVDLVREIPAGPERRFVFLHQRVNHANYTEHCSHLGPGDQKDLYIFSVAADTAPDQRKVAYENGLRCWDRNAVSLAEPFLAAQGAVHIFITADHSEMMGEGGLWGHSIADLAVAQVPVLLLTNRPQSDVAKRMRALSPPTAYTVSQIVARALGYDISTPGAETNRFYLNNTLPFGRAGYLEAEETGPAQYQYKVRRFGRDGRLQEESERNFPEMEKANR